MDQIITLLTNLFNLTKIVSVTLPGLLAAGGLALILWPPVPVDVIPVVLLPPEQASPNIGHAYDKAACKTGLVTTDLVLPIDEEGAVGSTNYYITDPGLIGAAKKRIEIPGVPRLRRERVRDQFVLDLEWEYLARCIQLEESWEGQEKTDNDQLSADLAELNTERTAVQTNYLKYQQGQSSLAPNYLRDMKGYDDRIEAKRRKIVANEQDIRERDRRVKELTDQQQIIKDRQGDPGRLRPRVGFDIFVAGLVSHVVGFILLSLAAALLVKAIDEAIFGVAFEDLFDGF